ncbi:MAG: BrnT family toxin [Candidatus Poribacteria bacterium]|nr:BrnT family toxin [Candidatus Poribacteria bacterium]
MEFEWDDNKARKNLITHKVSFHEAKTVFSDPISLTIEDPCHSQYELRYIILGYSEKGNLLVVVHTDRDNVTRIISARKAEPRERRNYEQSIRTHQ